jgi:hypothetical protein
VRSASRLAAPSALLAVAAFGAWLGACDGAAPPSAGSVGDDALPDRPDPAGAADSAVPRPLGTYLNVLARDGDIAELRLDADRVFVRAVLILRGGIAGGRVDSGSYRYSKGGDTRYIRFYDQAGVFIDRYAYQLDGPLLYLRADGSTRMMELHLRPTPPAPDAGTADVDAADAADAGGSADAGAARDGALPADATASDAPAAPDVALADAGAADAALPPPDLLTPP